MPTVFIKGPYRFFFYAGDRDEPLHVHVERDKNIAKFWLDPVRLNKSGGFNRKEIKEIYNIIIEKQENLLRSWDDYFAD